MMVVRAESIQLSGFDLHQISARFGIASVESIGGFENLLYRSIQPMRRVLRVSHGTRRSREMIEGEFAFMEHLANCGVPVVAPVYSIEDSLVEEFVSEAGDPLVISCMTEAPGGYRKASEWTESEIENYGALLGAMHDAATAFEPTRFVRRPSWSDPIFEVGLSADTEGDRDLFLRMEEINAAAAAHPAGGTDLLIHQDAHLGNLFITNAGEITLFDFDDTAYGTQTHDLAIVLFYWMMGRDEDPALETRRFLRNFLLGYERFARLADDWPVGADLFLSLREIEIYWLMASDRVPEPSREELRFLDRRRERILEGMPCLGVRLAEILS